MQPSCAIGLRLRTTSFARCTPRICLRLSVRNLASNNPRNLGQALPSAQLAKYTRPNSAESRAPEASAGIRGRSNAKHRREQRSVQHSPKSAPQVQHKGVGRKVIRKTELAKPSLQAATAEQITHFQERLVEIRANMHNQVANLDLATRILDVENDRLHPLVHSKHILELETTSALHDLLQDIAHKAPKDSKYTTQDDSTAIWLESRILAVQLWVVKRLLQRKPLEIENKEKNAQIRNLLEDIESQIWEMSLELATLRDIFHRVRPERTGQPPREGWDLDANLSDSTLESTAQPALSSQNLTRTSTSQSILLENLAVIAAYSQQESVIWKIERFLSRIEEIYYRISRVVSCLDQLAQELQVVEDRTHPAVFCKHVLQLNTFSSLDMTLRMLRKRTPKNRMELEQGMGEAVWLDSRLPEVQLEVVKMRLWAFHLVTKSQDLSSKQKNLIRSIRGRIKVAHSLLRNSRKEFGSYKPQRKLEIDENASIEEGKDHEW